MNRRQTTIERVDKARTMLLINWEDGVTSVELAEALGITRAAAIRLLRDVGAVKQEGLRGGYTLPLNDGLILLAGLVRGTMSRMKDA
jgi:hypothetical protein